MGQLKNWDNKTWLSSNNYIKKFNKFLIKNSSLNRNSKILDIGCGRGKILGNLSNILKLRNKPVGLDIENHKDKDKRFKFKKISPIKFLKKNTNSFDLILIKQTIHLFKINQIIKLIYICKKHLNKKGRIIILTLDPYKNEIPTFNLMNKKLKISLYRDKKILDLIQKFDKKIIFKNFVYKVKILKKKYIEMIFNRYISVLLNMSETQINMGIQELEANFKKEIQFKDKLICLILNR
jgi:ubiquinone/menaquinone biosynthesis C-methylase UbiE